MEKLNFQIKKSISLVLLFIFTCMASFAQTAITGSVKDASTGEALSGVTVIIQGTTTGTVTDMEGKYAVAASGSDVLLFSFIGYLDATIEIGEQTVIDVSMEEDIVGLEEVVVVGYGTQRRKDVTGSIASIGSEGIREKAASNLSQSLQGRIAGVEMTQTSSRPGSNMQIRIRGTRSLTGSNDPLIILDGIPFAGTLSDINPNDIRSVDILKDASAAAVYGSRGANGVILITSIKGDRISKAKPVVQFNSYYGVKKLMNRYPMMDAQEFIAYRKEAAKNGASWTAGADEDSTLNTDWQDLMFENGIVTSQDLSISGASETGNYSIGLGYFDETSILPGQDFERFSLRGSIDQKIGKRIKIGLSTMSSYGITEGEETNLLGSILAITPLTDPYNADGSINTGELSINNMDTYRNPLEAKYMGDRWVDERKTFSSYNNIYGEIQIIDGLRYRLNVGLNYRKSDYGNFKAGESAVNGNELSSAIIENELKTNYVIENLLYYDKTFGAHKIGLVGLFSTEETAFNKSRIGADGVTADYLQYYNFGLLKDDGYITIDPEKWDYYKRGLNSLMFRANYALNNKYLVTFTLRSEKSSVFREDYQRHTYPGFSIGWNATNEDFMKSITWLSYLKPRLGYGQTSNQGIDPYSSLGQLATNYYNFGSENASGYYVAKAPNQDLGWEYSSTMNYAIDFGVLDNRITGTFEYYSQKTKDVLVDQSLPMTSGVTEKFSTNIGETENKGIELSLNATIINKKDFSWDVGFNLYSNKNKIVALASGQEYDKGYSWFVGEPIDAIYDFKKIGIWQKGEEDKVTQYEGSTGEVGMIKVEYTGGFNAGGTPERQIGTGETLEDDDRQILGSINPDFQGGFNTKVAYKGFDLSIVGFYRKGGILVSAIHSPSSYLNLNSGRRGQIQIDYWTESNPTNAYPKPYGPQAADNPKYGSTLAYFDGSYVKISNITIGYNFKMEWIQKIQVDKLRAYVTVQNPLIFGSDYYKETKLDPQPNTRNDDKYYQTVTPTDNNGVIKDRIYVVGFNTPATRNFLFGLNVTF